MSMQSSDRVRPAPRARAAWVFVVCLLAFALAAPWAVSAPPDVTDATASLARLPGFKLLRGLQVVASGNGVFGVTMKKPDGTPATGLSAYVLKGSAGWHGTVVLSQPASFTMPGLDQIKVNVTNFAVVASEAADSVPLASLPPGLASGFSSFSDPLPLKQGINVFVAGSVDGGGTLGTLRRTLGMQSGDVLFAGTVGPAVFLQVVQKAGAAAGSDADDSVSMTLTLPTVIPPPFNALSAYDRQKLNLQLVDPSLTVAKAKGASTWSVTGAMTANVTAFEQRSTVDASLSVASDHTITIRGSAALAAPLKPFGVDTVQISALGVDATIGGAGAKDLAISADVKLGASKVSARFAMRTEGRKLKEISAGLSGSIAIPGLPSGESLSISDPTVGLMTETKDGFVSGSVTWRNLSATAVVYGRKSPSGVAAFIKLKEDPSASLAKIIPGAPEMKIPKTVAVLSSIAIDDLPLDKLPSAAGAMLASIGKKTSDKVKAVQGLTLYTAIKLHDFASDFADGDALVVGGSVGVDHGRPAFSLSADFPDFKMPDGVKKLGLSSAKPSLYVSLSSKPELQVGVALDLGLKDGNQDILLTGKIYAVVGTSGVGVKVAGFLKSDWDHPFGLDGITLKAPMGMQFSMMADGSVAMLVDGGAQFNANVNRGPCGSPEPEWCTTIRLGGGFGILFSSGLPTIKGIALRVSMSQIDLLTPVKIGQTIIHAAAGVADKLVTKIEGGTRKGLPAEMKSALGTVKNADIVGVIDGIIPSTGAARDLASVKLKDVEIFLATPGMDAGADFRDLDDVGFRLKGTLLLKDKEIVKVDNYLTMKKGFQILVQPGESIANFAVGPLAITTPSIDVGAPIPGLGGELPHFKVSGAATLKGVNLVSVDVSLSKTDVHVKAGAGFNSCAPLPKSRLRPGAEIYLRGASGHLLRMNGNGRLDGSGPFTAMSDVPASYTTERWRVVEAGGGEIALYNPTHGRYLRAHDAIVDAGAKVAGGWERFEAIVRGDAVVLHNKHTKQYVSFAAGSLASVADGAAPSSVAGFQIYELSWRADPLSALAQRATQTAAFESSYAAATPANDTPCGTWGANAAIDGKMLSLTSFSLYGTGRFDPPPVLANVGFPTAGASLKLDSATGAAFSASVHWDAARFDLSGQFKGLQDWNMTGRAHVDGGSKDFWIDTTKVASLTVGPTDLSLAIGANADATLTASGSGNIEVIGVKNIAWNFSGKLSLDHEIKTTIQLPDVYGKKYTACPSDYTTLPLTCTRPADIFARTLGPCDPGYRTDPLTCWRDAHIYGNGCSGKCDAGYHNDGCTCRRDAHSYARSMGPCPAGYATDPATCRRDISTIPRPYEPCRSGYHDDGATCRGSKSYDIAFNIFP